MSLTFTQMQGLLHEIKPLLEGALFDHCLAASDRKFILHFKNQYSLLICFQEPFLRFHLTKHPWKNHPQQFSKNITQTLHLWHLIECSLLHEDRILILVFKKGNEIKKLICEFIPKKANCHLVDNHDHMITSLNPLSYTTYSSPSQTKHPSLPPEIISSDSIEKLYLPLEMEALFLTKKHLVGMQLKNQLTHAQRAKIIFSNELKIALDWEDVQHQATLLQSNLFKIKKGMTKVSVQDWLKDNLEVEILLDSTLLPAQEIAKRFQKSKKLKRGIEPLRRQLEQASKNVEKNSFLLQQLESIKTEQELKNFCQKNYLHPSKETAKKLTKPAPALPYRKLVTQTGLQIWVGKNAKDNDQLTFVHANGLDYWLHARDVPGSHVVLHLGKHREPDEESLKDALQAALFYSKAKDNQEGEVCITQCKHVTRFGKNQPGKVQISQHRVAYVKLDTERLRRLRERKEP